MYLFHDMTTARSTASLVLDQLFDGQARGHIPSAVQMGKALGISDVAVGKAMWKLKTQGSVVTASG